MSEADKKQTDARQALLTDTDVQRFELQQKYGGEVLYFRYPSIGELGKLRAQMLDPGDNRFLASCIVKFVEKKDGEKFIRVFGDADLDAVRNASANSTLGVLSILVETALAPLLTTILPPPDATGETTKKK